MKQSHKSWERSFPTGQIEGKEWVLDVISDLVDYCEQSGMIELEVKLREALVQGKTLIEELSED